MFLASVSRESESSEKRVFSILLFCQNCFPRPLKLRIPPSWTQFTIKHLCRNIEVKSVDYNHCIRVLIVQNFRKNLYSKIFLDLKTHLFLSPITAAFFSSIKVWRKNLLVAQTFSMVILSISDLALEDWLSDYPIMLFIMFHLDFEIPKSL